MPKLDTKEDEKLQRLEESFVHKPPKEKEREVIYPEIEVNKCFGDEAMTAARMKELMGWEDEDSYKARLKAEAGNDVVKGSKAVVGYGEDYMLVDLFKKKIRCWHNTANRPFDAMWAKSLAQDILNSGPGLTKEKRRWQINGETFIVGEYGQVLSGQHRGAGLILAAEEWVKDQAKWKHIWPTEPTLELIVVTGIQESQHVLRTLDITKPRSLADTFYTSDLFKRYNNNDKRECSRMLMAAVDLLWKRTDAAAISRFQTHGESADFLSRHMKLLEFVNDIFGENKDRAISNLRLSPGQCAAFLYLFSASDTVQDSYIKDRSQKSMKWGKQEKAHQFFVELGSNTITTLKAVRDALASLVDTESGSTGRQVEKHAILCKAWNAYAVNKPVTKEVVYLGDADAATGHYTKDEIGNVKFINAPTVGGIDFGVVKQGDDESSNPSEEEVLAQSAAGKAQRIAEMDAKAKTKAAGKPKPTLAQEAAEQAEAIRAKVAAKKAGK